MITLLEEDLKDRVLLTVVEDNTSHGLWKLYIGHWFHCGIEEIGYGIQYKTTKDIVMDANDLKTFANEIRRVLKEKPTEDEELALTFRKNEPQFKVLMRYMIKGQPLFRPRLVHKFELTPAINIRYSVVKYSNPDDQYLYEEDGGHHIGPSRYFYRHELERFLSDLEKEATNIVNA